MATTSTLEERELVIRLIESDSIAFEKLYYQYVERAYGFAFHFLRNSSEAEEIVQEVFTKLWEGRHKINPDLSFSGYLLTMVKNSVFNENRKKMYHRAYVSDILKYLQTHIRDMEEKITYDDLMEMINKTVRNMPPKRQEIFKLCRIEGMSHKSIAKSLGIAEKTIEAHMRLALRDLKAVLSPILDKICR
ncbi:MAG: RNA polymerase sigma-70 factor [Bacteroidales bacterium]|nr:RNA polymerase sigma-70 factor [Bacteroidales bacterium]